jgi:hypothetical protein
MQALALDQKMKELVRTERKITLEILLLIQTMDITKLYRDLGFDSLFSYLTRGIGYSEGAAQRRISSARLMRQIPAIESEIKSGELNLTQISLAATAFRQEEKAQGQKIPSQNKAHILQKLKTKAGFETQKILKQEMPSFEIPKPKVTVTGNDQVCVTLVMSESDWQKVQALQADFSHKVPDQKLESLLLYFANQVEAKKRRLNAKPAANEQPLASPSHRSRQVKKEAIQENQSFKKSQQHNHALSESLSEELILRPPPKGKLTRQSQPLWRWNPRTNSMIRLAVATSLRRSVFQIANGQCQFVSRLNGKRCDSRHFLEIDHILPIARGGTHRKENLRIYCREHNAWAAKQAGVSRDFQAQSSQ